MKRPRQHVMEDASGRLFQSLLPDEWIMRPIPKDYGVDFEIELVDQEIVSGDRVWVQLKSIEETKRATACWPVADRFADLCSDGNGNITAEYIPYSMCLCPLRLNSSNSKAAKEPTRWKGARNWQLRWRRRRP